MARPTGSRLARALALLPALLLLAWLALLAKDVWATKRYEDPAWVAAQVHAIDHYGGHTEPLTLEPDAPGADGRILVLGSSSVAAPNRSNFTDPLVRHLAEAGRNIQVTNIGWEGMTSWDLRARLDTALAQVDQGDLTVDGVVLYLGHNDVTYTLHYALAMPRFDALIAPTWVAVGEPFRERDAGDQYWIFAHRRVPRILKLLQEVGWLHLEPETFAPLEEAAVARFRTEVGAMVDTLRARGIPVLLVTPVGNLDTEPYGPIQVTTRLWQEGLATEDPAVRLQLLLLARDSEVFTPDMRAKSSLLNVLRDLGTHPGPQVPVQLCDLEVRLPAKGLGIGDDLFVDPVHLSEVGFDETTGVIAGCLLEGVLAPDETDGEPLAPPPPG